MAEALEALHGAGVAARLEWWLPGHGAAVVVAGAAPDGPGRVFPLDRAGRIVAWGAPCAAALGRGLEVLAPVARMRITDDALALRTATLLRRCEELEDFASLVAHEVRTQLSLAEADVPTKSLAPAFDVVDRLLEAARAGSRTGGAIPSKELHSAFAELGAPPVRIDAPLPELLPLPPQLLRVLFRNLISNAVAAGATRVGVTASRSETSWTLHIRDDGVGLGDPTYRRGSGLGLTLCRRALERLGGSLELCAHRSGGTEVLATFPEGDRP